MYPVDLRRVRTIPLKQRPNKVDRERFARSPRPGQSFAEFLASLPNVLAGEDLRTVVQAIVVARQAGRPVLVAIGGHVVKCGLAPVLISLMEGGVITGLAMNGSAAIHDFEVALIGGTSEDVAAGLKDGTFGMVRETGELMHRGINRVLERPDLGMGAVLADMLSEIEAPYQEHSLLAAARRLDLPITVHIAIGTDTLHMHPSVNGAALGQATFNDFQLFVAAVTELNRGVFINMGSAVLMPEVFLKAFTVAQNLGSDLKNFVTVNMDMTANYRPTENVVRRPATVGGQGYTLLGRHEIMIPLLAQAVIEALAEG